MLTFLPNEQNMAIGSYILLA